MVVRVVNSYYYGRNVFCDSERRINMNKRKFEKMCSGPNKVSRKIKKTAEYLVDNEITFEGARLTGDARNAGVVFIGTTMAIGENLTKRQYMVKGFVLGSIITLGGVVILGVNKIKEEKHERKSSW
jgi:hypothetical protein